jgi:hypothetical protein
LKFLQRRLEDGREKSEERAVRDLPVGLWN